MMHRVFFISLWVLIVKVQPALSNSHKYISGTAHLTIKSNFRAHHFRPPLDCRFNISAKQVNVM